MSFWPTCLPLFHCYRDWLTASTIATLSVSLITSFSSSVDTFNYLLSNTLVVTNFVPCLSSSSVHYMEIYPERVKTSSIYSLLSMNGSFRTSTLS